jgi:hypothetical protein
MMPFRNCGNTEPAWWTAYNNIKHSWSSSTIDQANMDNVLDALAGAFLINAVHYPSVAYLYGTGDLRFFGDDSYFRTRFQSDPNEAKWFNQDLEIAISNHRAFNFTHVIETGLFIYKHHM